MRLEVGLETDGYGNPTPTFEKNWKWVKEKLVDMTNEAEQAFGS